MTSGRLSRAIGLIDAANALDPNTVDTADGPRPAELVYGERMTAMLAAFRPGASEHLTVAARAQHVERWTSPRSSFPDGRAGYLKWRAGLKDHHARRAGELMAEAGYGAADIARTQALIRKQRLKQDEEAQALEDVICLVFLKHYAPGFIARHADDKVIVILAKTARKMSPEGLAAAGRLTLDDRLARLLGQALSGYSGLPLT